MTLAGCSTVSEPSEPSGSGDAWPGPRHHHHAGEHIGLGSIHARHGVHPSRLGDLARSGGGRDQRHQHLVAGERAVAADQRGVARVGRVEVGDRAPTARWPRPPGATGPARRAGPPKKPPRSSSSAVHTHASSPYRSRAASATVSVRPGRTCSHRNRPSPLTSSTPAIRSASRARTAWPTSHLAVVGGHHQGGASRQGRRQVADQPVGRRPARRRSAHRSRGRGRPCRCRRSRRTRRARPPWPAAPPPLRSTTAARSRPAGCRPGGRR